MWTVVFWAAWIALTAAVWRWQWRHRENDDAAADRRLITELAKHPNQHRNGTTDMSDIRTDLWDRDPYEDGDREYLLDEDIAAEQVATIISDITGAEVDGDGAPWGIVLEHLAGIASVLVSIRSQYPEVDAFLSDEYGWSAVSA